MITEQDLLKLKEQGKAPEWMTLESLITLSSGYLQSGETPVDMYRRVAKAASSYYPSEVRDSLESKFYDIIFKGWLGLATPVASNMGTSRGLPISCFSGYMPDTLNGIFDTIKEVAVMTKYGGGTAVHMNDIRSTKDPVIGTGGTASGPVSWAKILDSTIASVSQGAVRRGAVAAYLPIEHHDAESFMMIRHPSQDKNRHCPNIHHGVNISDNFMQEMLEGNKINRAKWKQLLATRFETGEPYLFFSDTAQQGNPKHLPWYRVNGSNLCLHPDTKVLTKERGPIEIKKLEGQEVTIYDGTQWVKNSNFRKTNDNEQLFLIKLSDGSEVKATSKHRWFVKPAEKRESEVKSYTEVTTADLVPGMKIQYHNETYNGDKKLDGAYLKGFLLAEGTTAPANIKGEHKPLLWIYADKIKCIDRLISSGNEVGITEGLRSYAITSLQLSVSSNNNRFSLQGLGARRTLTPWCSLYKQKLPEDYLSWDFNSKVEFIAGLFDGDGTYMKPSGGYQLASIHKEFLIEIKNLLLTMGIRSSMALMRPAGKVNFKDGYGEYDTKDAYRITISSYWAYKLSSMVSFSRLPQYQGKEPNRVCVDFNRIVSIEPVEMSETYCTIVPSTGKFALANGLMTGNCNEIMLHTDSEHSLVCCLSSMNLAKYDEWKDTDAVKTAIYFLDAVMQEFISKAYFIPGLERAYRSAVKGRALGLGVLGWHTILQSKLLPFDSFEAMMLNARVFSQIQNQSLEASRELADLLGEPEWMIGTGMRNTHVTAIAPTVSNALISGGVSQGIEPISANVFVQKSAKGTFIRTNPALKQILSDLGLDSFEVWDSIIKADGSVLGNKFLPEDIQQVFLTAREVNQFSIIKQAGQRQKYLSQGQSVNLFFSANSDPKYIHNVHADAWKEGLKGLYYLRSTAAIRSDLASRSAEECVACHA